VALHCSHEQWRRGAKEEEGGREVSGKTNRVTSPGGVAGGDGSGSSSVYLHFFFSLFMFSRFSVFSSISVDDGAVVAADGGVAVAVLLLFSVSPCFFFLFVLFGFSPLFFLSIRLCFFSGHSKNSPPSHLISLPWYLQGGKKGRKGYYPCPVVAQG
jgi:hypothetical protein